jgi:hypothetical protein
MTTRKPRLKGDHHFRNFLLHRDLVPDAKDRAHYSIRHAEGALLKSRMALLRIEKIPVIDAGVKGTASPSDLLRTPLQWAAFQFTVP